VSFFAVASYGGENPFGFSKKIQGGKNADLALQVVAFSHQGILFSSSAKGA